MQKEWIATQELGHGDGSSPQPQPAARVKGLTKSCIPHNVRTCTAEEWSFMIMLHNYVLEILN